MGARARGVRRAGLARWRLPLTLPTSNPNPNPNLNPNPNPNPNQAMMRRIDPDAWGKTITLDA